jgi:hypothetical protein
MKKLILMTLAALSLFGCATATRLSIPSEEKTYRFVVRHSQTQSQAFNNVELALADSYDDLPAVLKLKQPETGTYLLKPLVQYQAGGAIGAKQYGRYTLKIVVEGNSVTLDFELGPEETEGTWAPESEIPKIRAIFQAIADKVAEAVHGTID